MEPKSGSITFNFGLIKYFGDDPECVELVGLNSTEMWCLIEFLKTNREVAWVSSDNVVGRFITINTNMHGQEYTLGFIRNSMEEEFINDPYAYVYHIKKHKS